MSYNSMSMSGKNSTKNTGGSINKSNVTLWKSKYTQGIPEEDQKVENEYIDNLKKQVYFMEMELKLMKEREKEIEKTGGFTQLFNDDRDPSQHILQLKTKYANMRKIMENKLEDMNNKKREISGQNASLKSKLDTLKKLEKEMFQKFMNLEEKSNQKLVSLENEYLTRNRERLELEANNRLQEMELKNEIIKNQELEYTLKSNQKLEEQKQQEFEKQMTILENMTKEKIKTYETVNEKIKELETKTSEEPYYKIEFEKNAQYKKKIEQVEREICEVNTQVEVLDLANEYIVKKKEEVVSERKKLIGLNDDLKREIEAKMQLNEIRIQKKVKENNSEEIQKLEAHLQGVIKNISELEGKIQYEIEKSRMFSAEIIKLNLDLKHKEEKREVVTQSADSKFKQLEELKDKLEELKREHYEIKEKVAKEKTDNLLLRNRYKLLAEEYSSVNSKYNHIVNNSDYTSNLKKISVEDLKNLTKTNSLVNESILNFASKVGSFKNQNLQNLFD